MIKRIGLVVIDEEEKEEDIKFRKCDEIISKSNQGSIPKVR